MKTNVTKWGNSFGIRIPVAIAKELGILQGSKVNLKIEDKKIIIEKADSLDDMLSKITQNNVHSETNWGEQEGKEVW